MNGFHGLLRGTAAVLAAAAVLLSGVVVGAPGSASVDHPRRFAAEAQRYTDLVAEESAWFGAWHTAALSHATALTSAKADPEQWDAIPSIERAAEVERGMLLADLTKEKGSVLARIDSFRDAARSWVHGKRDRSTFSTAMGQIRGGFKELFSACADVKDALFAISVADGTGAQRLLDQSGFDAAAAEEQVLRGVKKLRSLG